MESFLLINSFQNLLKEFERVPKVNSVDPTFMEIAGFPHYENVCSNILAFFFDSHGVHGFKDLFLKSIFEVANVIPIANLTSPSLVVHREYPTNLGQRIDILIDLVDTVLVIENKVYVSLTNDLEHYADAAEQKPLNPKQKLLIVLSLWPVEGANRAGFINVTYDTLINTIKKNLGEFIMDSNPRYVQFLTEFLKTIENLITPSAMDQEVLNFFKNNHEAIGKLQDAQRQVENEILGRVTRLQGLVTDLNSFGRVKQWIWKKHDLVHDFYFPDGVNVCVDCFMNLSGTTIDIWVRGGCSDYFNYIKDNILFNYTSHYTMHDKRFRIHKDIPFDTPLEELANMLNPVLELVGNNKVALVLKLS